MSPFVFLYSDNICVSFISIYSFWDNLEDIFQKVFNSQKNNQGVQWTRATLLFSAFHFSSASKIWPDWCSMVPQRDLEQRRADNLDTCLARLELRESRLWQSRAFQWRERRCQVYESSKKTNFLFSWSCPSQAWIWCTIM